MPKDHDFKLAMTEIGKNREAIEKQKTYYKGIFKVDIKDICNKFDMRMP
jgi:hypothetical protein